MSQILERRKKPVLDMFRPPAQSYPQSYPLIRGPFGWPYPVLNAFLQFIMMLSYSPRSSSIFPNVASRRREYVRDSQGRIIEVYEEVVFE